MTVRARRGRHHGHDVYRVVGQDDPELRWGMVIADERDGMRLRLWARALDMGFFIKEFIQVADLTPDLVSSGWPLIAAALNELNDGTRDPFGRFVLLPWRWAHRIAAYAAAAPELSAPEDRAAVAALLLAEGDAFAAAAYGWVDVYSSSYADVPLGARRLRAIAACDPRLDWQVVTNRYESASKAAAGRDITLADAPVAGMEEAACYVAALGWLYEHGIDMALRSGSDVPSLAAQTGAHPAVVDYVLLWLARGAVESMAPHGRAGR